MKKNIQYLLLGVLALMSSCQDPEYVLPTAERQGITSLTALFTSGPYVLSLIHISEPTRP